MAAIPNIPFIATPTADRLEVLGSQVHRILAGGDVTADSPYTRRDIMLALEEVRRARQGEIERLNKDKLVAWNLQSIALNKAQYYEDYDALYKMGGTADAWIKSFVVPVLNDAERGVKYFMLPEQFVSIRRYQNLPGEEGIHKVERVRYAANLNHAPRYIPVANGQHSLLAGLYRGGLQGNIMVVREDDRGVLLPEPACAAVKDEQLRVSVVLRPERDGLPEPGLLQDATDMDMVMGAVQLLLKKGIEDKVSDNNTPTVPTA